jgi:hypothetical protein
MADRTPGDIQSPTQVTRLNLSLESFAARLDFVGFDIWIMPCFPMAAGFEAVHIPSFCAAEGARFTISPS